jgi:capsular polysaccharide biosynthesis protein
LSRISAAKPIEGRFLYLGHLQGHFGHFLLETLARSWALVDLEKNTKIIVHHRSETLSLPSFAKQVFAALDIDPSRIVIAHSDLVVEELIVPSLQYWIYWKASPGVRLGFDRIRERLATTIRPTCYFPQRIYLTRRFMKEALQRRADQAAAKGSHSLNFVLRKSVLNEEEVEAVFAARGYEIIAPELRPFNEQVMLIANALEVAGITGSALHLALFCNNPNTRLIALDLRLSVSQLAVEAVRGLEAHHIYCIESRDEAGRPRIDCQLIRQVLTEHLSKSHPH